MQRFVGTFLVIVVCLAVFTSPVNADDVLNPGDIAIIGFNFDNDDEFAFVCLKEISAGTEIRFTDQGWKSTGGFLDVDNEGLLSWEAPSTGCKLGEIVKIRVLDFTSNIKFSTNGDQILAYQFINSSPKFIFALNSDGFNWTDATGENNSAIPSGLDATNSVAIVEIDNAIHTGGSEFFTPAKTFDSPSAALASIVIKENWKGSNDVRQDMPTGSFSFTTTAVHLREFSAKTGGQSAPWWIIAGLVIVPVIIMVVKRPKRNCCN